MTWKLLHVVLIALFAAAGLRAAASVIGPWKFKLGDDPAWAAVEYDDSAWESVDFTPAPGARDGDVGLTGYVPGWTARGHPGYSGYAWYRCRVQLDPNSDGKFAVVGPPAVDSVYQAFADGVLLGGCGKFELPQPIVYSVRPRIFALTATARLVAIRVWMGRATTAVPNAGGIRIAPLIGEAAAVRPQYIRQWRQTILGYIVEVAEAAVFLALAYLLLNGAAEGLHRGALHWIAGGLVVLAMVRGNQAVFFWTQFENVRAYDLLINVLLVPFGLGAWTLGVLTYFEPRVPRIIFILIGVAIALYACAQIVTRSWLAPHFSPVIVAMARGLTPKVRWACAGLWLLVIVHGLFGPGLERRLAACAALLVGIGLFATELSALHLRGIWFPFGVGVSRTQYAYLGFDVVMVLLVMRRTEAGRSLPFDAS